MRLSNPGLVTTLIVAHLSSEQRLINKVYGAALTSLGFQEFNLDHPPSSFLLAAAKQFLRQAEIQMEEYSLKVMLTEVQRIDWTVARMIEGVVIVSPDAPIRFVPWNLVADSRAEYWRAKFQNIDDRSEVLLLRIIAKFAFCDMLTIPHNLVWSAYQVVRTSSDEFDVVMDRLEQEGWVSSADGFIRVEAVIIDGPRMDVVTPWYLLTKGSYSFFSWIFRPGPGIDGMLKKRLEVHAGFLILASALREIYLDAALDSRQLDQMPQSAEELAAGVLLNLLNRTDCNRSSLIVQTMAYGRTCDIVARSLAHSCDDLGAHRHDFLHALRYLTQTYSVHPLAVVMCLERILAWYEPQALRSFVRSLGRLPTYKPYRMRIKGIMGRIKSDAQ